MSFFESSCENIRMSRPYTAREYLELMGTTGLEESTECYGFARNDDDCRSSANHAIAISESSIATSAHSCNSCNTPCTCLSGMTSALNAILATVGQMAPGFRVSAEITLKSGTVHSVTFGNPLEPVEICSTTVSFGDTVISVCDIAKIHILSGGIAGSNFELALLQILHSVARNCTNCCSCCCSAGEGERCAQDMQNYICENRGDINSISYVGGSEKTRTIATPTSITHTNVVGNVTIDTSGITVVSSVSLATTSANVVASVTGANTNVVTSVGSAGPVDVVVGVAGLPISVSGPVISTPTSVVTSVSTVPTPGVVSGLVSQKAAVIDTLDFTTASALTGFQQPSQITGVLSGVTAVAAQTPVIHNIPTFSSTATSGVLQITIAAGSIDGVNPVAPITIPVTVSGATIEWLGNETYYVMQSATPLWSGNPLPTITTVNQQGASISAPFVNGITTATTPVVETIAFSNLQGSLVESVATGTVGSVNTAPATVQAIGSIVETTDAIPVLGTVTTLPASSLFTTTSMAVLNSATLTATDGVALSSATAVTTLKPVVENFTATAVDVLTPNQELIGGNVAAVGCGIMNVANTNGDVSVYSVCDIESVTLD